MSTVDIKKNFHDLIDRIDDENLLLNFYELVKKSTSGKKGNLWSNLTKEEQEELLLAFEESKDERNLISHNKVKQKNNKWL